MAIFAGALVFALGVGSTSPAFASPAGAQQESAAAQGSSEGQRIPLLGKITAVKDAQLQVLDTDGDTVTVNISGKTEFRRDRQPAKKSDFKVGDIVLVRGEEAPDHSWNAQVIAARSTNGPGGPGGRGGFGGGPGGGVRAEFGQVGTLGKDFVAGEVKSIDAPKLSVLRNDSVTQTIELNEETSLRKGRESVTMADIQVGDHLFARGAMQNEVFVPKTVVVIGPEQWKRMQEMGREAGAGQRRRSAAKGAAPGDAGSGNPAGSDAQKPAEPQN